MSGYLRLPVSPVIRKERAVSNYRIAYQKGFDDLKRKEPRTVASFLHVRYSCETECFTVPYFGNNFCVNCIDQTVTDCVTGNEPPLDDAILILHYLTFSDPNSIFLAQNKWVSLKEIPNGGALFYPAFHQDSILALIDTFGNQPSGFTECARRLHASPSAMADVSAVFEAFPLISLCAAVWEGDDEFEPNATILFDPSIAQLLHIESIIGLGMRLTKKLIEQNSCE